MIPLFKVFMSPHAKARVGQTLDSGYVGEGPRVKEFERRLQEVWGLEDPPVCTNSGTSALELALDLIDVRGREVI